MPRSRTRLGSRATGDFPAALFGPRPAELLPTPWHAPERPIYVSGPHDNARAVLLRLESSVGARGFEHIGPRALPNGDADDDLDDDDDDDDDFEDDANDTAPLVHSPLERTVSRDGTSLRIYIYRGPSDAAWLLEIEDHLGGSTVWDDQFPTDREALDAALLAIEDDGIESFVVPSAPAPAPV